MSTWGPQIPRAALQLRASSVGGQASELGCPRGCVPHPGLLASATRSLETEVFPPL